MIKVLFDHQIFSEQLYGGISRYFSNLYAGFNCSAEISAKIGVRYSKNHYLKAFSQPFDHVLGRWFLRHNNKRFRWNRKYSEALLKKGNYDVFHATYYDTHFLQFNRKPLVVTIHDMIHENNPEMFLNSEKIIAQKREMMSKANAIIAISHFTKSEIIKYYPNYAEKTFVVYHGFNPLATQTRISSLLPNQFMLFVGERSNYKNFVPMVKALAPIFLKNPNLQLVCAGGKEFNKEEMDLLKSLRILSQCKQLSVNDELLSQLYQNAQIFIYPSSQEGFGLPILEAFQHKCVVACSNQSCLPEIGGDAVHYFDPRNEDNMRNAVETLLNDDILKTQLRERGLQRLDLFPMQQCIANTISVYKTAINAI